MTTALKTTLTASVPPSDATVVLTLNAPVMSREAFAAATGLPIGVLNGQIDRGYWPMVTIGKRSLVNVEAVRREALKAGEHYTFPA